MLLVGMVASALRKELFEAIMVEERGEGKATGGWVMAARWLARGSGVERRGVPVTLDAEMGKVLGDSTGGEFL